MYLLMAMLTRGRPPKFAFFWALLGVWSVVSVVRNEYTSIGISGIVLYIITGMIGITGISGISSAIR